MTKFLLAFLSILLVTQAMICSLSGAVISKGSTDRYSEIPNAVIVNQVLGFLDDTVQMQLVNLTSQKEVTEFSVRAVKILYPQLDTLFLDAQGRLMTAKIIRFVNHVLPKVKAFYEGNVEGYRRLLVLTLVLADFVHFTQRIQDVCRMLHALFDESGALPMNALERLRAGLLTPWRASFLLYRLINEGTDDSRCAALLLQNNLEPDVYSHVQGQDFATMSQLAASNGSIRILAELIRHGADLNILWGGSSVLLSAVRSGRLDVVQLAYENGARGRTDPRSEEFPLHEAAFLNAVDIAEYLIKRAGNSVNQRTKLTGRGAPLHFCVITRGDPEMIKLLLEAGADVNIRTELFNRTALFEAIIARAPSETIRLLINHPATDPNLRDGYGTTPLIAAISELNVRVVRELLVKRADPRLTDDNGKDAFQHAKRRLEYSDQSERQRAQEILDLLQLSAKQ